MKSARQTEILKIIERSDVQTQEQLLEELQKAGISTTQATISRDIKELHLVKTQTGIGTYRYAATENKASPSDVGRLQTIFREAVTSFDAAQNLVVIKTMPGLAPAACSALDNMDIADMLGSLAGDDTGVLILRTTDAAASFCAEMHKMLK